MKILEDGSQEKGIHTVIVLIENKILLQESPKMIAYTGDWNLFLKL